MSDPRYCYPPDYTVLINKFGLTDPADLDYAERLAVRVRMEEGVPTGGFDLAHLQAIHHHLFQDVYVWAGQVREVDISKDGQGFQSVRFIETGMADVHRRLKAEAFLKGRSRQEFAQGAGEIIGDVNHVHPFREGNGRTQTLYLQQLAEQAGHRLHLHRLGRDSWIAASIAAQRGDYGPMRQAIAGAMPDRSRAR